MTTSDDPRDPGIPAFVHRETAVLAGLFKCPQELEEVRGALGDGDSCFQDRPCGAVYRVVAQLKSEGMPVTPIAVWARLQSVGDEPALDSLQDALRTASNMVGKKPERALLRRVAEMATREGQSDDMEPSEVTPVKVRSILEILESMRFGSPRIATGIHGWDGCTAGGIRIGALTVVLGPPGSGKTTLLAQVARSAAQRGIAVGWLAVDEDAASIVLRHTQAVGVNSEDALNPSPQTIETAARAMKDWKLLVYEDEPVESVFQDLAIRFPTCERIVCIDSLQTARTHDSARIESPRERIDNVIHTCKRLAVAPESKSAVIVTSEVSRGAYRNRNAAMNIDPLVSGKESGAIEFQADQIMDVRNVTGSPDLISVTAIKARGPNTRRGTTFTLRLNRLRATFEQTEDDAANAEGLERDAAARKLTESVLKVVAANPGCSKNFVCEETDGRRQSKFKAIEGLVLKGRLRIEAGKLFVVPGTTGYQPEPPTSPSSSPPIGGNHLGGTSSYFGNRPATNSHTQG